MRDEIARTRVSERDDIPGPFAGAVGYLSYEVARHFERLPRPEANGLGLPDFYFMIPRTLVIFDHVRSELEIVALPPEAGDADAAYDAASADHRGHPRRPRRHRSRRRTAIADASRCARRNPT